eukprot:gene915-842_t
MPAAAAAGGAEGAAPAPSAGDADADADADTGGGGPVSEATYMYYVHVKDAAQTELGVAGQGRGWATVIKQGQAGGRRELDGFIPSGGDVAKGRMTLSAAWGICAADPRAMSFTYDVRTRGAAAVLAVFVDAGALCGRPPCAVDLPPHASADDLRRAAAAQLCPSVSLLWADSRIESEWGGHLTLLAIATIYNVPIWILSSLPGWVEPKRIEPHPEGGRARRKLAKGHTKDPIRLGHLHAFHFVSLEPEEESPHGG